MQCITTCIDGCDSGSGQGTIATTHNDSLLPDYYPFGVPYTNGYIDNHDNKPPSLMDTVKHDKDDSMFRSVEISTFNDIFTDEVTMKWMATMVEEETKADLSTTMSDEMISDDQVDSIDDTILGDFLWDALVCT
jgi:hypothetical protein